MALDKINKINRGTFQPCTTGEFILFIAWYSVKINNDDNCEDSDGMFVKTVKDYKSTVL